MSEQLVQADGPSAGASFSLLNHALYTEVEMDRKPLESDWKTFKKRVPEWRERYLQKKNDVIIGILKDENKTPTERFWDAKERMKEEAKILVDCLAGHSRSKIQWFLLLMHRREARGRW